MNEKRDLVNTNSILQNPRLNLSAFSTPKMASSKFQAPFADSYNFKTAEKLAAVSKAKASGPQYLGTLNGVQQSIRPEQILRNIEENTGFWGGNVITKRNVAEGPSGAFARKRDNQSVWENQYYKGGICRYKQ